MIKSVILDLGRTLIPFDFSRGYRAMEGLCPYPAAEIPARIGKTDLVQRFECGMVEPRAFVRELSAQIELDCDYDRFCEIWSSIFLPEPLIPGEMLEALHRRYRLVLLSNTNALHFEMLSAAYPLLQNFDRFILSHEVGAMKPDPRIYRAAIAAAQCAPGECFFADDIQEYVDGAILEGIDAVRFESRQQLERDMRSRGIDW